MPGWRSHLFQRQLPKTRDSRRSCKPQALRFFSCKQSNQTGFWCLRQARKRFAACFLFLIFVSRPVRQALGRPRWRTTQSKLWSTTIFSRKNVWSNSGTQVKNIRCSARKMPTRSGQRTSLLGLGTRNENDELLQPQLPCADTGQGDNPPGPTHRRG